MNTDATETPSDEATQDVAPAQAGTADTRARISEAMLSAAHAVSRHYTDLLMSRRSRTSGPR